MKFKKLKNFLHKIRKGYSLYDLWNVDLYIIRKLYPILKEYYYMDKMSHPIDITVEKWNEIIKEILFSCQYTLYENDELSKKDKKNFEAEYKDILYLESLPKEEFNKKWKILAEKQSKGFELLGKYLLNMWD
ncbi:MAG: hypothetical protein ACOC3V_00080 [bacterium]